MRKYLVDKHAIQSAGWFKPARSPPLASAPTFRATLDPAPAGSPSRRIEIILFTPQT